MVFVVPPTVDVLVFIEATNTLFAAADGNERDILRLRLRADEPLTTGRAGLSVFVVPPADYCSIVFAHGACAFSANTDGRDSG